jgi:hypothetical protein
MFISLALHTCNLGTAVRTGRNPFTGQLVEFPIDDGLTPAEKAAVIKLLTEVRATPADEEGWRTVFLRDGSKINVSLGVLFESDHPCVGCKVEFDPYSSIAVSFIFTLAQIGNMSVGSSIDPNVVALVRPLPTERVAKRWPNATITTNPEQLEAWLRKCIDDGSIV